MIRFIKGNLLESDAAALVNTVNTVGVMGKGLALQFKEAFPENYALYRKACMEQKVHVGTMFITEDTDIFGNKKVIVNFPTKTTWRKPSEYIYIKDGLVDLRNQIQANHWESIAIPPLGSHNGGLDWIKVKEMIVSALSNLDCDIQIYEPSVVIAERMKSERVKLTPARAMLLYMLCMMTAEGEFPSEFASEKLAYFMQRFGAEDIFKLEYKPCHNGPYSGKVKYVLHYLNGSYLKGVGQMEQKPFDYLWLAPDTLQTVTEYLSTPENQKCLEICNRTAAFLSGYYSNYLLELLSTSDYILNHHAELKDWKTTPIDDVLPSVEQYIQDWSDRKRELFNNSRHIRLALAHLYSI